MNRRKPRREPRSASAKGWRLMRYRRFLRELIGGGFHDVKAVALPPASRRCAILVIAVVGAACIVRGDDGTNVPQHAEPFVHVADIEGITIWPDLPFSADGGRLVTVRSDGVPRVWEVASCKPLTRPLGRDSIGWAQFTSDGKTLFTASNNDVRFWDVQTSTLRSSTPIGHELFFSALSPDGTRFLTEDSRDVTTFHLWRSGEAKPFGELSHSNPVKFAAFDSGSARIITREALAGTPFHLWDARTGLQLGKPIASDLESADAPIAQVAAFDQRGKRLVIAREAGFSMIEVETGRILSTGHTQGDVETDSIRVSADGTTVAVLTNSKIDHDSASVQIFESATGKFVRSVAKGTIMCDISPDGRWLLCHPVQPNPAELWDLSTGSKAQTFPARLGDHCLSPDGATIAFADSGKTSIWRLREKQK